MSNEGTKWTEKDIQKLKELVDKKYSKKQIAQKMGRSITAIDLKCRRLNITVLNSNRKWIEEEYNLLRELWIDSKYTTPGIARIMNRPVQGIIIKAQRLSLGPRDILKEDLSISDICNEMQVSHDRVHSWIKYKGLKKTKNKAGKCKYKIKVEDLLKFLKDNPSLYDASKISEYLFANEPKWLTAKRKEDANKDHYKQYRVWTNEEDKKLEELFKLGFSVDTVAEKLNRSRSSIISRKQLLFIGKTYRRFYSDEEKEYIKLNSPYMTISEMKEQKLKNRSIKSITYMCEKLGVEYHTSKLRCKQRE